jgi:hypothetical protein
LNQSDGSTLAGEFYACRRAPVDPNFENRKSKSFHFLRFSSCFLVLASSFLLNIMIRRQRAFATAIIILATTVVADLQQRNKNEECLVWHDYHETTAPTAASLKNGDEAVIRTALQLACRVKQGSIYEFGIMDISSGTCRLHRDPTTAHQGGFQIAMKNYDLCEHFHWAPMSFDVDPLGPNILVISHAPDLKSDIAICRYDETRIGRMVMDGRYFGHCAYLNDQKEEVFVGGNFQALNAIPRDHAAAAAETEKIQHTVDDHYKLVDEIQKRVILYLSGEDKRLIESVSGHPVEELIYSLNNTDIVDYDTLTHVLSMDRFIPHHALNVKGLSLLRAVLAERMTLARRRHLGLDQHVDAAEWEREGVLLKDFDYYTNKKNLHEFDELLQMVAASKDVSASNFQWVERNVTSLDTDPQQEPHIDTFHSVIKMWVYEKGVVTEDTGPLHFMRGSNRNTMGKLKWIYDVSLPPATEAIKEPSLRFRGEDISMMPDVLRPVLPLDCYERTLIIADTSGIHHRGHAIPGTVRRTTRLTNGNDGGLPRQNPYLWDGWDRPAAAVCYGDETECSDPASSRSSSK